MSLNDPQWGKRGGGSGPPDLDEIWRNVNRRLAELFGRKTPGEETPPEGPSGPKMKFPLGGVGLLVALALLVWLASGFYIVDEGRRGVVTRFGKFTDTTLPGPRWHLPFPVEAVELVDFSQVKTIEVGYRNSPKSKVDKEAVMLTDDENIIDIQFAVQYNLKSAEAYVFNNRKPDQIAAFVAESAIREVVGKAKMDFVLYEGREQIAKQTEQLMQQMLDRYGTGIYVQKVPLPQPSEMNRPIHRRVQRRRPSPSPSIPHARAKDYAIERADDDPHAHNVRGGPALRSRPVSRARSGAPRIPRATPQRGSKPPLGRPGGRLDDDPHAHCVRCPRRGSKPPLGRPGGRLASAWSSSCGGCCRSSPWSSRSAGSLRGSTSGIYCANRARCRCRIFAASTSS